MSAKLKIAYKGGKKVMDAVSDYLTKGASAALREMDKKPKKFLVKVNGKTVAGSDTRDGAKKLQERMKKSLKQEEPKKKFKIQVISHEDDLMEQAMRMGAGN